jgi:hypothetical protein
MTFDDDNGSLPNTVCGGPASAPDTLSQTGALALAKRLQDHWHQRG